MKHDSPKYKQLMGFLDIVFNMMMAYAFLFTLSYMLVNKPSPQQDAKVDPKAEAMVVMSWPDWATEDLDLWLLLPSGDVVYFSRKTSNLINLERDDRGLWMDMEYTPNGPVITPINKEVIVFRGLVPGTYTASVHFYSEGEGYPKPAIPNIPTAIPKPPYPVKVEVVKLNPTYTIVASAEASVVTKSQEYPMIQFTITSDFQFADINKQPEPFIAKNTFSKRVPAPAGEQH